MQETSKPRIAVLDFQEQGCAPGLGRSTAESIAALLSASLLCEVVDRAEWIRRIAAQNLNHELSQECRFHPAWVAERLALLDLDAAVIGRVRGAHGGKISITAMNVGYGGIASPHVENESADRVATSLISRRSARAIRIREHPIEAKVECVRGSSMVMRVAGDTRLRPKDRLRIDRVLESVPDPYLEDESGDVESGDVESRIFAYLTASIGEAEVLETGRRFILARYSGNAVPRAGDNLILAKI